MSAEIIIIVGGIAVFWSGCGIAAYGLFFAFLQDELPLMAADNYHQDKWLSCVLALAGPVTLMVMLIAGGGKHGMKFK